MDWLQHIDEKLLLIINGNRSEVFDNLMTWASGKLTWWPFYLFILGLLAWHYRWKALWILLFVVLLISLSDQTSVHFFKNVFHRLRPCHEPGLRELIVLVNNHCGGKYGFISSHAANSFALAIFLRYIVPGRWFAILILAWACLVSYSRVYLGVHYPFDIIVGAAWGSLLGWAVAKGWQYSAKNFFNKSIKGKLLNDSV